MDIDYSLNAITIRKTGFFFAKFYIRTTRNPRISANEIAKKRYNSYLTIISKKIEAGEFPSDEPKDELMEEALLGIRNGEITPQILVLIRTKKITRKTIRDDTVKVVLDDMGWKLQEDFY